MPRHRRSGVLAAPPTANRLGRCNVKKEPAESKRHPVSATPLPHHAPRDPVVTGMGLLSQVGTGISEHRDALKPGTQVPFSVYEPGVTCQTGCQLVGAYREPLTPGDLGLERSEARFMGRMSLLAVRAARLALEQSGLPTRDLAVVVGTGTGEIATHREVVRRVDRGGRVRVLPTTIPRIMASTVSANLATVLKTRGPSLSVTAACAGGAYNLAIAASWIRKALWTTPSRAESRRRTCTSISGSTPCAPTPGWTTTARSGLRGPTPPIAPVSSSARAPASSPSSHENPPSGGAWKSSAPSAGSECPPTGAERWWPRTAEGAELAIRRALRHSGVPREAIGYVNTHGTSTPLGDISEVRAIRRVFDDALVPYGSTKGYTGHTVSAAGALEAAFTLLMLGRVGCRPR